LRGVNEGRAGGFLDGEVLLAILDVFSEDDLRSYILGHLEGVADLEEDLENKGAAEDEEDRKEGPGLV
jgi:hypothetical protein